MAEEFIKYPLYNVLQVVVATETQRLRLCWKRCIQVRFYPASSTSNLDSELELQLKRIDMILDTSQPTGVILAHIAALSKTSVRSFVQHSLLTDRETLESHCFVLNGTPIMATTAIDSTKYPHIKSLVLNNADESDPASYVEE